MALVGSARPGKAGLGYTPRSKQPKPKRGGLVGKASPGKAGVGGPMKGSFGNKPNFQKPSKAAPKVAGQQAPAARVPRQAQPAAPDSVYNDAVDLAGRKEEQRLGALDTQEAAVKREFGIEDPSDPFSRANGLKAAFLSRQKAASAGLASQGQLYSGAHERALSRTRREEEQARHELRQSYEQAIGAIGAEKAGVKFATEEERAQAFEDWLARAPEAEASDEEVAAAAELPEQPGAPGAPAKGVERDPINPGLTPVNPGPTAPGEPRLRAMGPQRSSGAEARARQQRAQKFQQKVAAERNRKAQEKAAKEAAAREQAARANPAPARAGAPAKGNRPAARPRPRPRAQSRNNRRGGRRR